MTRHWPAPPARGPLDSVALLDPVRVAEGDHRPGLQWASPVHHRHEGDFRPARASAATTPRRFPASLSVWNGSATSTESTEFDIKYENPLISANPFHETTKYARSFNHCRERIAAPGQPPAPAVLGGMSAPFLFPRPGKEPTFSFARQHAVSMECYRNLRPSSCQPSPH